MISFTSRPLTSGVRTLQCPLTGSLSGPRRQYGRLGKEKTVLPVPVIQPLLLHHPARRLITVPTELCRLHTDYVSNFHGSKMNETRRVSEEIQNATEIFSMFTWMEAATWEAYAKMMIIPKLMWEKQELVAGFCLHGNEPLNFLTASNLVTCFVTLSLSSCL